MGEPWGEGVWLGEQDIGEEQEVWWCRRNIGQWAAQCQHEAAFRRE